jgi:hypothetical protein
LKQHFFHHFLNFSNMKISKFLFMLLAASMVAFSACKKEEDSIAPTEITALERLNGSNYANSKNLFLEAYKMVEIEAQKEPTLNGLVGGGSEARNTCPTVSASSPGNTFPKTLTLDFSTGCTTLSGKTASGKIIAVFSGAIKQKGTNITVTFQNFTYNGYTLSGTYVLVYTSATGLTAQITDGKIVTPDAKTITYQGSFTFIQTEGMGTTYAQNGEAGILEDVYSITGSGSGTDQTGKTYVTITTPLIKKLNCEWITTGVIEIKATGAATKNLDFGAGTCDNMATLRVGLLSTPITLP